MSDAPPPPSPLQEGTELMQAGRFNDALPLLEKATAEQPTNGAPQVLLAACLIKLGRPTEALTVASRAVQIAPTQTRAHVVHSQALSASGRHEDALRAADAAARFGPRDLDALVRQCDAHLALGHAMDALSIADSILEIHPNAPAAHIAVSRAALAYGNGLVAERHARKAVELAPDDPAGQLQLARALEAQTRMGAAAKAASQAVSLSGESDGEARTYHFLLIRKRRLAILPIFLIPALALGISNQTGQPFPGWALLIAGLAFAAAVAYWAYGWFTLTQNDHLLYAEERASWDQQHHNLEKSIVATAISAVAGAVIAAVDRPLLVPVVIAFAGCILFMRQQLGQFLRKFAQRN